MRFLCFSTHPPPLGLIVYLFPCNTWAESSRLPATFAFSAGGLSLLTVLGASRRNGWMFSASLQAKKGLSRSEVGLAVCGASRDKPTCSFGNVESSAKGSSFGMGTTVLIQRHAATDRRRASRRMLAELGTLYLISSNSGVAICDR